MKLLELKLKVSNEVLEQLQDTAGQRGLSLDDIVSEMLEDYFDEPTDEEILEDIRQALLDVKAGRVVPIDEALAALKREFGTDADSN